MKRFSVYQNSEIFLPEACPLIKNQRILREVQGTSVEQRFAISERSLSPNLHSCTTIKPNLHREDRRLAGIPEKFTRGPMSDRFQRGHLK